MKRSANNRSRLETRRAASSAGGVRQNKFDQPAAAGWQNGGESYQKVLPEMWESNIRRSPK